MPPVEADAWVRQMWPEVDTSSHVDERDRRALTWTWSDRTEASIHRDGQAIFLEMGPERVAQFAVKFVARFAAGQNLVLTDEGYSVHVDLAGLTESQVALRLRD